MSEFREKVYTGFVYAITWPVLVILTIPSLVWIWAYKIYSDRKKARQRARNQQMG